MSTMTNISKKSSTLVTFFLVFTSFYSNLVSCFATSSTSVASQISYSDHCSSFVPEPTQKEPSNRVPSRLYYVEHSGYYASQTSPSNSLVFQVSRVYTTGAQDLFSVDASLVTERRYFTYRSRFYYPGPAYNGRTSSYYRSRGDSTTLSLRGYWSESSGKMCLVGGVRPYRRDDWFTFPVSVKVKNFKNSSSLTNLVTGTLESLLSPDQSNPNYFESISFVLFTKSNHEYSLVSEELRGERVSRAETGDVSPGLPLNSIPIDLVAKLLWRTLELNYSGRCGESRFATKCSPLGDSVDHLPGVIQLKRLEISYGKLIKMWILIKFLRSSKDNWGYSNFDPNTTLVGEGIWEVDKNRLFIVACRFLNATESWAEAAIGDCSTRLSLSFPAIWSIGHTSSVVGHVWSNKSEADSGYFDKIGFRNSDTLLEGSWRMKYEYTEIEKAKKWCPRNKPVKNKRRMYPEAFSYDMSFDIFGESDEWKISRGYAKPLTIGDQFFNRLWHRRHFSKWNTGSAEAPEEDVGHVTSFNASYEIGITLRPKVSPVNDSVEWYMSAEGIYDTSTGSLCMVGCRNIGLKPFYNGSTDCEILVRFQFPQRDSSPKAGFIRGIIDSKRRKTDPFHFERFQVSSAAFVANQARKSVRKADAEIVMAVVSNALSCVFAALQLFHLRRNPHAIPLVSLAMLSTLLFGYAVALVNDLKSMIASSFESLDVLLGSGGWLESKGVSQGVTALILVLLQARLLHRGWSGRFADSTDRTRLCVAEKEAALVSLPLYLGAAFSSTFFAWRKRNDGVLSSDFLASYSENPFLVALRYYADTLSDAFLLPQVLLNMFANSREKALSRSFYVGTSLVRVLPHAYGVYEAWNAANGLVSVSWDAVVALVSLVFAAAVFLQQKFGGRCILPVKFKESSVYEKVSNVAETET